jgi:CBS domain-containing protein
VRALDLMIEKELDEIPVAEGGRLVGALRRADVLRFLETRETPARPEQPAEPRRAA